MEHSEKFYITLDTSKKLNYADVSNEKIKTRIDYIKDKSKYSIV
jgi:hypothetical protein